MSKKEKVLNLQVGSEFEGYAMPPASIYCPFGHKNNGVVLCKYREGNGNPVCYVDSMKIPVMVPFVFGVKDDKMTIQYQTNDCSDGPVGSCRWTFECEKSGKNTYRIKEIRFPA